EADDARTLRRRPLGRGVRHAAASATGVRGVRRSSAPGRRAHRRPPYLPTVVPVALRERCRLRRGIPRDRAERDDPERSGHALSNELIAITGGSGFVGSHVVDALLGAGYDVRVIDPKPPLQANVEWADVD